MQDVFAKSCSFSLWSVQDSLGRSVSTSLCFFISPKGEGACGFSEKSHTLSGVGANEEAFDTFTGEGAVSSKDSSLVALTSMGVAAFDDMLRVLPGAFASSRGLLILWVYVLFFGWQSSLICRVSVSILLSAVLESKLGRRQSWSSCVYFLTVYL